MIPKIIHYCWFGSKDIPQSVSFCIDSWRKHHADYELMLWNESNIDIEGCAYATEARKAQKWAFLSDYVRIHKLYEHGGIYFDTDVEVVKSLDPLRVNSAFIGFESPSHLGTSVIAAVAKHPMLELILNGYKNRSFILEDGKFDYTTNVEYITSLLVNHYGLSPNGERQMLAHHLNVFPSEYFSPISFQTGLCRKTTETYSIHHFSGTWLDDNTKNIFLVKQFINRIFGIKFGKIVYKVYRMMSMHS